MSLGFPGGPVVKNLPANAGDVGSIPGSRRSPGEGSGNPLQYSCLENPMDRNCQATVHGVGSQKCQTQLNNNKLNEFALNLPYSQRNTGNHSMTDFFFYLNTNNYSDIAFCIHVYAFRAIENIWKEIQKVSLTVGSRMGKRGRSLFFLFFLFFFSSSHSMSCTVHFLQSVCHFLKV